MHWEFNGNIVENPEMLGNVVSSDVKSGQLNLVFQHLNESNTGRYRCVMQDGLFSIVSEAAELALYGKMGMTCADSLSVSTYILYLVIL